MKTYNLTSLGQVERYWYDMWEICISTPLGESSGLSGQVYISFCYLIKIILVKRKSKNVFVKFKLSHLKILTIRFVQMGLGIKRIFFRGVLSVVSGGLNTLPQKR